MLKKNENFTILSFKIIPNSSEFRFMGIGSWSKRVRLKIKSPAINGKANQEIIENLTKLFSTDVEIIKGKLSNQKEILIKLEKENVMKIIQKQLS
ncbi:MAG: DUF167 family protein [Candidatus Diapherotrites archaeon]